MVELFLKFVLSWSPKSRLEEENGFHRVATLFAICLTNLFAMPIMGYHFQQIQFSQAAQLNLIHAALSLLCLILIKSKVPTLLLEYFVGSTFLFIFSTKAILHTGIFSPFLFFLLLTPAYFFLILRTKHGVIQMGLTIIAVGAVDIIHTEAYFQSTSLSESLLRTIIIQFFAMMTIIFFGFNHFMTLNQETIQKYRKRSATLSAKCSDQFAEIKSLRLMNQSYQIQLEGNHSNSEFFFNEKTKELRTKQIDTNKKIDSMSRFSHHLLEQLLKKTNNLFSESNHLSLTHLDAADHQHLHTLSIQSREILNLLKGAMEITEGTSRYTTESDFDFRQLVGEILYGSQETNQNYFLNFSMKTDAGIPRYVKGNSNLLSKAILGILSHTFATTPKGNITLHTLLKSRKRNSYEIEFQIKDSGIVLPKAESAELFTPFASLTLYPTLASDLSGLELPLAQKWIHELGGTLNHRQDPHIHGNLFSFTLKFNESNLNRDFPILLNYDPEETLLSSLKVVILDENKINRNLMEKAMRTWQTQYRFENNVASLMKSLDQNSTDLVFISSEQAPQLSNYPLEQLREQYPKTEWITMGDEIWPDTKTIPTPVDAKYVFQVMIDSIKLQQAL